MNADWEQVRGSMMLDPRIAYLNTGSYGIVPRIVFDRVTELRRLMQTNPVDFIWRSGGERLWAARTRLAAYLHAQPERLIFTLNVSSAMNLVAWALQLAAPGDVLMTDHEYGAMHFAWERAAQRQGLNLRHATLPRLPREPGEVVQAIAEAITPRTRLLFVSHVLHTTGMVLPVKAIAQEARRRGVLTLVDGAHAPGMLPLDLDDLGCDFYGANLHKWLLAPIGAAFLHCGPGAIERLVPMNVSWGWHYDHGQADVRDAFGSTHRLRSFEFEGSRDVCSWLAVPTAIEFHETIGNEAIRARQRQLARHVRQCVGQVPGLTPATPEHPELCGGLTAFALPDLDGQRMRQHLWERHGIEINVLQFPHGQYVRVSTHCYNSEAEIELLARSLPAAMAAAR